MGLLDRSALEPERRPGEMTVSEMHHVQRRVEREAERQGKSVEKLTKGMKASDVVWRVRRGDW
jgi:hypothetical protein